MPEAIVTIGASQAAVCLADALRSHGYSGELRMIGAEEHPPYQRPPLSKAFLGGGASRGSLALRSDNHYRDNAVELVLGETAVAVERGTDGSGVVRTRDADGRSSTYHFDRLVLATGARPRQLSLPGIDSDGVLELRSLDDAVRLAERVAAGPMVVVGGGFIGLEVAATVRTLGGVVTVVESGPALMGRAVGAGTARFLHDAHVGAGIEILLDTRPTEIVADSDGGVRGVVLGNGRELPAATVLVGIGVEPRVELAQQIGLSCVGGIVVDDRCVTSDGATIALGDCTVQPAPVGFESVRTTVRLESVDNATEQAAAAARTLLGLPPVKRPAPWFWSDQGAWKLQTVGLVAGHDAVVVRSDSGRPDRLVTLYFRDDCLIAAECVNAPADFLALRGALTRGVSVSTEAVSDVSIPLKRLLTPARA
ncbi:NAD(P)/FAD-dependent oxidoreductase [Rhodococcus aetherivorans]|uniref:NAD(P)/FAD-dependent oxidoreductase n=1 Tax=Rhodococcus aetherivorans TaxID=191292 RepID=UPI00045D5216|nr:FAD-dependent oxidoreductase [Rhodococcus aetherivorans]KDE12243.1 ferredoxin reductase [Rhodococcus aetherivorans]